jgi:hypothetical protein
LTSTLADDAVIAKIPYTQEALDARESIVVAARNMLAGNQTFIEGARLIFQLSFSAQLEQDPDILPFVGIASETDALPIGQERKLWNADALAKLQPEIDRLENWARDFGTPHCESLVGRFG